VKSVIVNLLVYTTILIRPGKWYKGETMEKLTQWMEEHFVPIAAKIGSQKHLVAIRDSFIAIMPVTMAGSIAVLLNVFFRDLPNNFKAEGFVEFMQPIIAINGNVWFGTIAVFALVFVFSLGYNVSKAYNVNPSAGGLIAFAAYITSLPQVFNEGWGAISVGYTGAASLFSALIIGLITTMIYVKLTQMNFVIKMPDSVPPAVSKAFVAIIPGTVAIFTMAILTYLSTTYTDLYIGDLVNKFVQEPFLKLSQGLPSILIVTIFVQLFWFFGLHGTNVLAPLLDGVYKTALGENTLAYEMGKRGLDLPHVWTRGSFDAYAWMGGAGATLALLIAILIFSKREGERAVASMSLPMGVFNINEPVTFGLPIVLNSIYFIPYVIITPIMVGIAYFFTVAGIIPPVAIEIPWIMPPVIYAFLATGGSIAAALVALLNFIIAIAIWSIFVVIGNKLEDK
jgi:cellobiose PTS system EIIC component